MTDQFEDYKQFILSADARALIKQLKTDLKTPLISAQNLINVMVLMQEPSEMIQEKMEQGELDGQEMLGQITDFINQALDMIDFYNSTLDEGQ